MENGGPKSRRSEPPRKESCAEERVLVASLANHESRDFDQDGINGRGRGRGREAVVPQVASGQAGQDRQTGKVTNER